MTAKEIAKEMRIEISNATAEFIKRLTKHEYNTVVGTYIHANLWVPKEAAHHLAEVAITHHSHLSLEELTDYVCLTIFTKGVHAFQDELQESGIKNKA